jgi:thiosulfate/3-mercaptopyruvate sulfurtransferase
MGLCKDHHIIVYTKPNCFSAARVWWMFQAMNHAKVSVLDGGIEAWKEAGGPTEPGTEPPTVSTSSADFEARLVPQRVVNWQQVLQSVEGNVAGRKVVVDARSEARFKGTAPEPRPGLRSGHIPTAVCVPFSAILQENYAYWRPVAEMRTAFEEAGVDLNEDSRVISSCGSGVTACVLALGMHLCGKSVNSVPVYDGSWTEWGGREDLPIERDASHV